MKNNIAVTTLALNKIYNNGVQALFDINLQIIQGEFFALLGPNGAGKTTLLSIMSAVRQKTSGKVTILGHDIISEFRQARAMIGLVPQRLANDGFASVWNAVTFSRRLFNKPDDPLFLESLLKRLSLWERKNEEIRHLSGGTQRRVMIAKAMAHEPDILLLDEPCLGLDLKKRKLFGEHLQQLQQHGTTIIFATNNLDEAQENASRIGILNKGKLILTENKMTLLRRTAKHEMIFVLRESLQAIPEQLQIYPIKLINEANTCQLILTYNDQADHDISDILERFNACGIRPKDIYSRQRSLKDIFLEITAATA